MIAPQPLKRGISWITGWINLSGWVALVATNSSLASTLIINIISLMNANYVFQRWHQFLIYLGITLITFLINAFMQKLLPHVNGFALAWSIGGFFIISITVLACAAPDYATGEYVFGTFINETGVSPSQSSSVLDMLTLLPIFFSGQMVLHSFSAFSKVVSVLPLLTQWLTVNSLSRTSEHSPVLTNNFSDRRNTECCH